MFLDLLEHLHKPPQSEQELFLACLAIEGLTFAQLALINQSSIPQEHIRRKGWAGNAIEKALGTTAGTQSLPDFCHLNIELKTIPINERQKPAESTFISSIPLLSIHREHWLSSTCYQKLKRILWVPVEGARNIPFEERRIGKAFLWSPTEEEESTLAHDWLLLTTMIGQGKLEEIDASIGTYLQVRPKGCNARALCYGFDLEGNKVQTLPRGFYLRRLFTEKLLTTGTIV